MSGDVVMTRNKVFDYKGHMPNDTTYVERPPKKVYKEKLVARSFNYTNITWQTNGQDGACLDPHLRIRLPGLKLGFKRSTGDVYLASSDVLTSHSYLAPRSNCILKNCSKLRLVINNWPVLDIDPRIYIRAFERALGSGDEYKSYGSAELNSINTGHGGLTNPVGSQVLGFGNRGMRDRCVAFMFSRRCAVGGERDVIETGTTDALNADVDIVCSLDLSPFVSGFKALGMPGIPHITNFELKLVMASGPYSDFYAPAAADVFFAGVRSSWFDGVVQPDTNANATSGWQVYESNAAVTPSTAVQATYQNAPELEMTWYYPENFSAIPPAVKFQRVRYEYEPLDVAAVNNTAEVTSTVTVDYGDNPAGFLIYIHNTNAETANTRGTIASYAGLGTLAAPSPPERLVGIKSISVIKNGSTSLLGEASTQELYRMYCNNASGAKSPLTYGEWVQHGCVVYLSQNDLGGSPPSLAEKSRYQFEITYNRPGNETFTIYVISLFYEQLHIQRGRVDSLRKAVMAEAARTEVSFVHPEPLKAGSLVPGAGAGYPSIRSTSMPRAGAGIKTGGSVGVGGSYRSKIPVL